MKARLNIITMCLTAALLFTNLRSQNTDIHWLRCINQPVNVPLDNAMKFTSNTVTPLMIGVPVGLLAYEYFRKD